MHPPRRTVRIGVVGAGEAAPEVQRRAEAVGREIAARGAALYCGGLGGVMSAAARAAREAGGVTVGILPGTDPNAADRGIAFPVATGMDQARNVVLVRSCDAIVAVGGGYGTLSEIAVARKVGVPVVGLGTWRLDEGRGDPIPQAESPEEAVRWALEAVGRGGSA